MKHKQKYKETIERERTIKTTCDFCGEEVNDKDLGKKLEELYSFDEFGSSRVDIEIEIRMSNGCDYGTGYSKTITVDACPKCFKTEILDRAKISTTTESDY